MTTTPIASLIKRGCNLLKTPRAHYTDGELRSIYRILAGTDRGKPDAAMEVQIKASDDFAEGWTRSGQVIDSLPKGWESAPITCAEVRAESGNPPACDGCQVRHAVGSPLEINAEILKGDPAEVRRRYNPARSTDLGNAERLVELCGERFRHCPEIGWLVWDGTRWSPDPNGVKELYRKRVVPGIYREVAMAAETHDSAMVKELVKWAVRSEANAKAEAAVSSCAGDARITVRQCALNRDKYLLNLRNGTLDLRTGKLRPHDQADLITKVGGTDFDPLASCPEWDRFLVRIFSGNRDLIEFVQRACGLSMSGNISEHVLLVAYGRGRNGKSTLLETVSKVLGEYWVECPTETITTKRQESGASNELARLAGARMVTANETDQNDRLAESRVKAMTGGDSITARFLYKEHFTFLPEFKLWLRTNNRPVIRGTDDGIWRRIKLIPFVVQIPDEEEDKALRDRIWENELPGVLNWMLAGFADWQRQGLGVPAEVIAATKEYREESDFMGQFLGERTVSTPISFVQLSVLYKEFIDFCKESEERVWSKRQFLQRLAERGMSVRRAAHGIRVIDGIRLIGAQDKLEDHEIDLPPAQDVPEEPSRQLTMGGPGDGETIV